MGEEVKDETFAEAKGLPAIEHAKKLAKEKSKKAKESGPASKAAYCAKGDKIIKLVAKHGKIYSVYIGSKSSKKHKAAMDILIKKWTEEGVWFETYNIAKSHLQGEKKAKG